MDTKGRCAFTLVELLVAIGVIAVLGAITVVAVRGISADVRLSSGLNTVTAVLSSARTEAMKRNQIVLVVFRPRFVSDREQVVEAVLAQWTGETYVTSGEGWVIDRFIPLKDVPVRSLPRGVKVACPLYGTSEDDLWVTQTHLPAIDQSNPICATCEEPGQLVAVMYAPDGTTITRNPRSDPNFTWIDFAYDPDPSIVPTLRWRGDEYPPDDSSLDPSFFSMYLEDDECFVNIAPYVAVYDDEEAREQRRQDWTTPEGYEELTGRVPDGYIATKGRRVHFNRYTGVVMTVEDR